MWLEVKDMEAMEAEAQMVGTGKRSRRVIRRH
jgi:hypothetical protein